MPHDNMTLAYKIFADVDVALHVALERRSRKCVMNPTDDSLPSKELENAPRLQGEPRVSQQSSSKCAKCVRFPYVAFVCVEGFEGMRKL